MDNLAQGIKKDEIRRHLNHLQEKKFLQRLKCAKQASVYLIDPLDGTEKRKCSHRVHTIHPVIHCMSLSEKKSTDNLMFNQSVRVDFSFVGQASQNARKKGLYYI